MFCFCFFQALSVSSPGVPVIAFAKDRPSESFVSSSFAAVGVSWSSERSIIKQRFHRVAAANNSIKCIQGDLDPQILYAPDITIQKETARMVRYTPSIAASTLTAAAAAVTAATAAAADALYSSATRHTANKKFTKTLPSPAFTVVAAAAAAVCLWCCISLRNVLCVLAATAATAAAASCLVCLNPFPLLSTPRAAAAPLLLLLQCI